MDQAVIGQLVPEVGELLAVGQVAVDQQVGHLREGRMFGQLLDRIATIAKYSLLTVDERDRARAGARVSVTRIKGDSARLRPQG